jgi:RNA polymerase sigma factor (sigma-70 family)
MIADTTFSGGTKTENPNSVKNPKQNELEKLIAEYQPQLKSFIRNRVTNREDAEDILQDVFYQLLKMLNTAMHPIEHLSAWLYRVARNTIINYSVKKREEELPVYQNEENDDEIARDFSEVLFNTETSPSPETEYLRSMVWTELEKALAELPVEQREIYELTELDGIPVKEIARATGLSVNTLLSRKHYAVLHLRTRMKELYEEIIYT